MRLGSEHFGSQSASLRINQTFLNCISVVYLHRLEVILRPGKVLVLSFHGVAGPFIVMQPIAIITGILLGTSLSIGLSLCVVLFLFFLLMDDHPRLASEFPALLASAGIFVLMTTICAISFVGVLRERSWRWYSQVAMWSGVVMTVFYYLPDK